MSIAGSRSEGTVTADSSIAGTSRAGSDSTRAPVTSHALLNPNVAPFVTEASTNETGTKDNNKGRKIARGKAKGKTNKSSEEFNADFAKYETNVLQTKLREQKLTIKDLRFKNKLLELRVEDLERKQKQDLYEKYFPKPDNHRST